MRPASSHRLRLIESEQSLSVGMNPTAGSDIDPSEWMFDSSAARGECAWYVLSTGREGYRRRDGPVTAGQFRLMSAR